MMNKQKTSKAGLWKVATFLPLLALLLMAFGREGENVPIKVNAPPEIIQENQSTQPLPPPIFKIEMREDGNYMEDKLFTLEEISKKAEVFHKSNENVVVSIKVENEVPMERVTEIKEVLRNAKVQHINYSSQNYSSNQQKVKDTATAARMQSEDKLKKDESPSIVGTWRLVSFNYGGSDELQPVSEKVVRIKLITETTFSWNHYLGTDKTVINSAGGSYVLSGEDYTETIEYGASGMSNYIGKVQKFKVKIEKDQMELSGELSDGLRIKEVWERVDLK